jgi:hypothetical protein
MPQRLIQTERSARSKLTADEVTKAALAVGSCCKTALQQLETDHCDSRLIKSTKCAYELFNRAPVATSAPQCSAVQ